MIQRIHEPVPQSRYRNDTHSDSGCDQAMVGPYTTELHMHVQQREVMPMSSYGRGMYFTGHVRTLRWTQVWTQETQIELHKYDNLCLPTWHVVSLIMAAG